MGLTEDLAYISIKLDNAIRETMEREVADETKEEMSRQIEQYTFVRSRGPNGMGVRDKRNFRETVDQHGDTTILRVMDVAPFQSSTPRNKLLANVVETGDTAYRMPYPRPFMGPAEEQMGNGLFAETLKIGLQNRGFTII